jgi:hypothetical protein
MIIKLVEESSSQGLTILTYGADRTDYSLIGRVILHLSKGRLTELVAMSVPSRLLVAIVIEIGDSAFRALRDSTIIQLLQSDSELVRKVASLKCVRALPKLRLQLLLRDNMESGTIRFYNVIHWLDFGVSAPNKLARVAAQAALVQMDS